MSRELMARLNIPAARLSMGTGGVPEMTSEGIAFAMAAIAGDMDGAVFADIWWDQRPAIERARMADTMRNVFIREQGRRANLEAIAKLEHHIIESEVHTRRTVTSVEREILNIAEKKVEAAKSETWPWNTAVYAVLYPSIVAEIRRPQLCPVCEGHGTITRMNLLQECQLCRGSGKARETNTWRAESLGLTEGSYRQRWHRVYDWAFRRIARSEMVALKQFKAALPNAELADA